MLHSFPRRAELGADGLVAECSSVSSLSPIPRFLHSPLLHLMSAIQHASSPLSPVSCHGGVRELFAHGRERVEVGGRHLGS